MVTAEIGARAGTVGAAIGVLVKLEHKVSILGERLAGALDASGPAMRHVRQELADIRAILVAVTDELRDIPDHDAMGNEIESHGRRRR